MSPRRRGVRRAGFDPGPRRFRFSPSVLLYGRRGLRSPCVASAHPYGPASPTTPGMRTCSVTGESAVNPGIIKNKNATLDRPLAFDPGDRWDYGINIDWVGKTVEASADRARGLPPRASSESARHGRHTGSCPGSTGARGSPVGTLVQPTVVQATPSESRKTRSSSAAAPSRRAPDLPELPPRCCWATASSARSRCGQRP